jgi:hypothetical protein
MGYQNKLHSGNPSYFSIQIKSFIRLETKKSQKKPIGRKLLKNIQYSSVVVSRTQEPQKTEENRKIICGFTAITVSIEEQILKWFLLVVELKFGHFYPASRKRFCKLGPTGNSRKGFVPIRTKLRILGLSTGRTENGQNEKIAESGIRTNCL